MMRYVKQLTLKLFGALMVFLVLTMALLPLMNNGYAQTTNISIKGAVAESSNFHGVIMWTIINGDKGTIIIQSPVGRGLVHVSLSPSSTCDVSTPICLSSTVVDSTDTDVFKVGDTAKFSINADTKQETVSLLTGVLAGFDVTVNLFKVWNTAPILTSSAGVNSTNVTSTTNSTTPRHLTLSLNESVGVSVQSQ